MTEGTGEVNHAGLPGRRIGLLGATGSIGLPLGLALEGAGAEVVRFSRRGTGDSGEWRSSEGALDLSGLDAVINLAGEPVAQRWTDAVKRRIEESRAGLSRRLVEALEALPEAERPGCLISASAVGYYGSRGDEELRERVGPGDDYLAEVCRNWEAEAGKAGVFGMRVVFLRTGIVLGKGGEAWKRLSRVFRLGVGGVLGSGQQWMPWIHMEDEVAAILFVLQKETVEGAVNLSAPVPMRNRDFTRCLARALRRPAFLPVPGWALRLVFGEFAGALLGSSRALPDVLLREGFTFRYETLEEALEELCR